MRHNSRWAQTIHNHFSGCLQILSDVQQEYEKRNLDHMSGKMLCEISSHLGEPASHLGPRKPEHH